MLRDNFEDVTWYDDDHDSSHFKIRAGGTGEFVSPVDPKGEICSPLGRVELVVGCDSSPVPSSSFVEEIKR